MDQRNKDCLKRFSSAWADQDMKALAKCITDDVIYHASIGPRFGQTWIGKTDVLKGIGEMMLLDEADGELNEAIFCGNNAFHKWVYRSKKTGEVIAKGCDIFHFEDGLISLKDAYRKVSF